MKNVDSDSKAKIKAKAQSAITKKSLCPECNSELVERKGKYGNFIGCSNYPKCHYKSNNKEKNKYYKKI